jgi:hypothetical protein
MPFNNKMLFKHLKSAASLNIYCFGASDDTSGIAIPSCKGIKSEHAYNPSYGHPALPRCLRRHGWERIHPDRIEIVKRFYEGEFDDTKTDPGRRSIPLDSHGILWGVLDAAWQRSKHRNPGDLVFTNARGSPVNRRNLLRRQLKPTIKKLGLPVSTDFRSFRTMHSSLMSSIGVRPEVTRDNMGHATVDVTQNVYNRTWWEERVEAVSMAAATVWREFLTQPVPAKRM